jgi:hypothetical protein
MSGSRLRRLIKQLPLEKMGLFPAYLRMGNQGEILYVYDPLLLRRVIRISSRGETLYEHTYEDYDKDANLTPRCAPSRR